MPDFDVTVTGADEVAQALQGMGRALPAAVQVELTDQLRKVVRDAASKVPRRTGAAAASIDVQALDDGAEIVAGGRKAEYFGWLDFGGNVGRRQRTARPYLRDGRYVYPATNASLADIERAVARAVVEAGRANGVEVTGGG